MTPGEQALPTVAAWCGAWPRRRPGLNGGAALGLACVVIAVLLAAPARADSGIFTPVADSYVTASDPSANYGSSSTLQMDASPLMRSFLRFDVQLPEGATVTGATLELSTTTIAPFAGFSAYAVADTTWDESTIDDTNAPAFGAKLGWSGGYATTGIKSVTLPASYVSAGLVSIGATTTSTYTKVFSSREGPYPPRLVVTYSPASSSDATAPAAPAGVAASAGDGEVTLDWADNTEADLAGYRVYRLDADGIWPSTPTAAPTASTYTDTGLTNGTAYTYRVTAVDAAGNESAPSLTVTVTPTAALPSPAPTDPVIAAAGDIACAPTGTVTSTTCQQMATSELLPGATAVLTLGDNQYNSGALSDFQQSFDPTWGRFKALMHPAPGNHEYGTSGAGGYFSYFGSLAGNPSEGYYSFDIGDWHLVALNSSGNCSPIPCGDGSAQEQWLKQDLAAHSNRCTLAYWHHPRFSSGAHGSMTAYSAFWQDLYAAGADVVLNGHDHDYERFAPQDPSGQPDTARGIREFVVGTGGKSHYGISSTIANSQVHDSNTFGVLELTLHPTGYDWRFLPQPGGTFTDSGTESCH